MAIIKLTNGKYTGSSRDIKPINADIGASFYEWDTEDMFDKTINNLVNNGWKKRVYSVDAGGASSDTIKNKFTVKNFEGAPFLVIMAGTDLVNFELNDIAIGLQGNRFKALKVVSVPVQDISDFTTAVQGEFL